MENILEKVVGDVKISLSWIGEGWNGDYSPEEDENDEKLLRFDVYKRNKEEKAKYEWEPVNDASYCTRLRANSPKHILEKALSVLINEFQEPVEAGYSVKKLGEKLSWLSTFDFMEEEEKIYRITWEIDIYAKSPRKAAKQALEIMRDKNSLATTFIVEPWKKYKEEKKEKYRLDLDYY